MVHERSVASSSLLGDTLLAEEIALESGQIAAGAKHYRENTYKTIARGEGASLKPVERLMHHWFHPLRDCIRRDQRAADAAIDREMFEAIDADRAAVIAMQETLSACLLNPDGASRTKLWYDIGNAIAAELNMDALKKQDRDDYKKLAMSARRMTPRRANRWARKKLDAAAGSRAASTALGCRLFWHLLGVASVADYDKPFDPAFHCTNAGNATRRRRRNHKPAKQVMLHESAWALIERGHEIREVMRPRYMPMLVPPFPWQTKGDVPGGYIGIRGPLISAPTKEQNEAIKGADLTRLYECLTAVSGTPWRINKRVLAVQQAIWAEGTGDVKGVPPHDNLSKPPLPPDFDTNPRAKSAWKLEAVKIHRKNIKRRSERVQFLQKISIAEQFKDREAIYFPHQLDFRGRAYPIPLFLNHQGDDVCRGLLEFAESKPVEMEGDNRPRAWLYVHAANRYGFDKLSYADRIKWVYDHLDLCKQAATNPLETREFWTRAKRPWQFLAACMALTFPDAAARLPVQLDGTCNGLQHYAAMGRDARGAAAVNMVPADKPNDVYGDVTEATLQTVRADADAGNTMAQRVEPLVIRDVVKPNVMTSVYGATAIGARRQIKGELEELELEEEALPATSAYLQAIVGKCIGTVCLGAAERMEWLRKCASAITADDKLVRWVTPLGLPVVQPYRAGVELKFESKAVTFRIRLEGGKVKAGKHRNAFAPNFVHCIDATHMMLTAKAMTDAGHTFAAVHDSYWTHAVTCDEMNRVLREQFVRLHTPDLIRDLYDQLKARYGGIEIPEPPACGDYDLNDVLSSTYFFS